MEEDMRITKIFSSGRSILTKLLLTIGLLTSAQAQAEGTLYLVIDNSPNALYTVDTTTAVPTLVGAGNSASSEGLALSNNPATLLYGVDGSVITTIATDGSSAATTAIDPNGDRGLTFHAPTGLLYGGDNGTFESIDPGTGTITALASLPANEDVEGLAADSANNVIYGIGNDEQLYAYDIVANTWSTVGATTVNDGNDIGLAFDPTMNVLYAVDSTGTLYSINPATAATSQIGLTGLGTGLDVGLAFSPVAMGIPTLSEWSMMLLIMLLGLSGFIATRRKQF